MRRRPWPIVILALLHIFAPFGNLLLSAWLQKVSVREYITEFLHQSTWLATAGFFLILPLAGVMIYLCKKWSYLAFLAIMGVTVVTNFNVWSEHPELFGLPILFGSYLINVGLVSYFVTPAVRAPFMNERLRWWESKPRYALRVVASLIGKQGKKNCILTDISEGGVFLTTTRQLVQDEVVRLTFSIFEKPFSVEGKVVYCRAGNQVGGGFGVQFYHTDQSHQDVKGLVKALKTMGVPMRRMDSGWQQDFSRWATTVIKTGKGLMPEVPGTSDAPKLVVVPKAPEKAEEPGSSPKTNDKSKAA